MPQLPFKCMICFRKCLKPFNGLCEKCQKEEITTYEGEKK